MAEAAIDPPPPSNNAGDHNGLAIPPLDPLFFSQGLPDSLDFDPFDQECNDIDFDSLHFDFDFSLDDLLAGTDGLDSDFVNLPGSDPYQNCLKNICEEASPEFQDVYVNEDGTISNSSSSMQPDVFHVPGDQCMHEYSVDQGQDVSRPFSVLPSESNVSKSSNDSRISICPSPESQGSGNCVSGVSEDANKSVISPDSGNFSVKNVSVAQKVNVGELTDNKSKRKISLLKRKKPGEDANGWDSTTSKLQKSKCIFANNDDNCAGSGEILSEEDEKRRARLMRNRESAQLSRQRRKQYVGELEDKVRNMGSTIQDLNARIAYIMAENATLRQQLGGGGTPQPPMVHSPPGMYPPQMMYPWMPYGVPPYMVKSQGSQVPVVPIPKLKPHQVASAPKASKKPVNNKSEVKTKKVASVSFLGLIFFILLFGGLVPMVNVRYGGIVESLNGASGNSHNRFDQMHQDRILVNGSYYGKNNGGRETLGSSPHGLEGELNTERALGNGSVPLAASLYVPRNDKLVKLDGNLIIHSVLATERAMASHEDPSKNASDTSLAVPGDLVPIGPVSGGRQAYLNRNPSEHPRALGFASDSSLQEWFREGIAGPMLSSGMCSEVFQFDVSSAIVPASSTQNVSMERGQNSTQLLKIRNRRVLNGLPSLPRSSHNTSDETSGRNSQKDHFSGNNSRSSMIVSVLVDPKEVDDMEGKGVMGPKSISRIFVVVLLDSVKYVTYSCMLPFKGNTPNLVTT